MEQAGEPFPEGTTGEPGGEGVEAILKEMVERKQQTAADE
jgi:hypothetical protein